MAILERSLRKLIPYACTSRSHVTFYTNLTGKNKFHRQNYKYPRNAIPNFHGKGRKIDWLNKYVIHQQKRLFSWVTRYSKCMQTTLTLATKMVIVSSWILKDRSKKRREYIFLKWINSSTCPRQNYIKRIWNFWLGKIVKFGVFV